MGLLCMLDKSMDTLKVTVSHLQHRQMIPQWAIKGISISRKKECQGLFMGLLWRCQKTGGSWGVVVSMFIIGRCCLLALIIYLRISWVCIQLFPFITLTKKNSRYFSQKCLLLFHWPFYILLQKTKWKIPNLEIRWMMMLFFSFSIKDVFR